MSVRTLRESVRTARQAAYRVEVALKPLARNRYVSKKARWALSNLSIVVGVLRQLDLMAYDFVDCDDVGYWHAVGVVVRAMERGHELSLEQVAAEAEKEGGACWFEFNLSPSQVADLARAYRAMKRKGRSR